MSSLPLTFGWSEFEMKNDVGQTIKHPHWNNNSGIQLENI